MNTPKLKLDDKMMLDFVLNGMRTTRAQLQKTMSNEYKLNTAEFLSTQRIEIDKIMPGTETKVYMDEYIYRCGNNLVKATKHGRIKKIIPIKNNWRVRMF